MLKKALGCAVKRYKTQALSLMKIDFALQVKISIHRILCINCLYIYLADKIMVVYTYCRSTVLKTLINRIVSLRMIMTIVVTHAQMIFHQWVTFLYRYYIKKYTCLWQSSWKLDSSLCMHKILLWIADLPYFKLSAKHGVQKTGD